MKLDQISDKFKIVEGNWVAKSLDGVEKRFKTSDTAGRDAWAKSYAKPQKPAAPPAAPKQQGLDLDTVWRKVEDVVSNIFPDGDPIDWLAPWLQKQGVKDFKIGDILDQAAQKNGYNDIYDYYEQMKQQYGADSGLNEASEMPEVGDTVRTKKMQMTGKVERIEPHNGFTAVLFRTEDGRLMRAPIENISVVQKLADENGLQERFKEPSMFEIYDLKTGQRVNHPFEASDMFNAEIKANDWLEAIGKSGRGLGVRPSPQNEGSMGGINRSAPAQDVSYEKVLDEVMGLWQEACRTDELSVDTMQNYRKAVTSPAAVQTRPLRKLAKSVIGFKQAGDKIDARTGDRSGNKPKTGPINARHRSLEERLAEFLDEDDFSSILQRQHDDEKAAKRKPVKDIPFHGWTIRYRPASEPGEKVTWLVLNKKHEEVKRGESMSDKDAVADAEEWIKSGGGTKQQASSNVTVDFNVDFAREFAPGGETLYIMFDKNGNTPMVYVSTEPQNGFKRTHIRNQKHKMTATTTGLPMVTLSAKESNALGLQPNGRYLLGGKEPIDNNTAAFPLIFQGVVQGKGDMVKMGKPGLTVAHSREVDEDCWDGYKQVGMKDKAGKQVPNCVSTDEAYQGPWQGDPQKYAKAPKSSTYGKGDVRLSDLVKDTIDTHGVKWAFEFYVKKHGMPPRHFKIYAGL